MAVLQQILVPLLSVNDTILTVAEISFSNGDQVRKGDQLMVFETSKTTYDVISESDGFVEYQCISGNDYAVNEIVAVVYSSAEEVS